jgi:hypothetical protein
MKLRKVSGSALELAEAVAGKGDADSDGCAVMIDSTPQIERLVALNCNLDLHIPGVPLDYGVQDMGAGVRNALPHVRDALSFWIATLRQCSRNSPSDACCKFLLSLLVRCAGSSCRALTRLVADFFSSRILHRADFAVNVHVDMRLNLADMYKRSTESACVSERTSSEQHSLSPKNFVSVC